MKREGMSSEVHLGAAVAADMVQPPGSDTKTQKSHLFLQLTDFSDGDAVFDLQLKNHKTIRLLNRKMRFWDLEGEIQLQQNCAAASEGEQVGNANKNELIQLVEIQIFKRCRP